MKKGIELLIELQEEDGQISDVKEVLASIPVSLLEKERALERLRIKLADDVANLEAKKKDLRRKEMELLTVEDEAKKFRAHFYQVKTQKEAESLDHEIKKADSAIETLTGECLLLMDEISEKEKEQVKKKEELAGFETEYLERKKKAETDIEGLENDLQVLSAKRIEIIEKIDESLLCLYEKIRQNRDNLAISRIIGDTCSACSINLRSQLLNEVKEGTRIVQCENCLRILYV
jgi:predicted  nucleic acid-binding Zn-ribbon protein